MRVLVGRVVEPAGQVLQRRLPELAAALARGSVFCFEALHQLGHIDENQGVALALHLDRMPGWSGPYDSNPVRSEATAAGGKSGYSSGALARLIQTVRKPNAVAPKASQRFDDTNVTSAG
jgi:hypothetical protein